MLFNLIIGALAGYAARYLEAPLGGLLKGKYAMDKPDLRVLTFIALLLVASIFIGLSGTHGRPFLLLIGGGIGIFFNYLLTIGKEQSDVLKEKMDERKASAGGSQSVKPRVTPKASTAKTAAKKTAAKKPAVKKPAAKKPTTKK